MIIYEQRGRFCFKNGKGKIFRFNTLKEAVDAGGIAPDEEVQVSGVPYTVPAKDLNQSLIDQDDEEGED
tara:strand:+ start:811 stop:1017 length:207 start_codon:yes stop_codon:yes gene_type:complete